MSILDYAVFLLYIAATLVLGFMAGRMARRRPSDYFLGEKKLPWYVVGTSMVASDISSETFIANVGIAYQYGISAVWWVGSAALGSFILAFFIGPRIRRIAAAHDLHTVGDFLEWRFDRRVRGAISALLWLGSLAILAGQLIGIGFLLNAMIGVPSAVGAAVGGVVVIAYFTAGGLKATFEAWGYAN